MSGSSDPKASGMFSQWGNGRPQFCRQKVVHSVLNVHCASYYSIRSESTIILDDRNLRKANSSHIENSYHRRAQNKSESRISRTLTVINTCDALKYLFLLNIFFSGKIFRSPPKTIRCKEIISTNEITGGQQGPPALRPRGSGRRRRPRYWMHTTHKHIHLHCTYTTVTFTTTAQPYTFAIKMYIWHTKQNKKNHGTTKHVMRT
jgi:hypothetical protein